MTTKNNNPVWERVRGWYHFPAVKEPKMVKGLEGGAHYDFSKREILVDEEFIDKTCKTGNIGQERCLEGVLSHEVGHYMVFPRNLSTLILAAKMTDDFFGKQDKDMREFILQTYADMADDLASVLFEARTDAVLDMRKACQAHLDDFNRDVRSVMLAYLNHQAHRQYDLEEELKPFFERMKEIDFHNESVLQLRLGIFTFGNIILDMVKEGGGPPPGRPPGRPRRRGHGEGPTVPGEGDEPIDTEEEGGEGKGKGKKPGKGKGKEPGDCNIDDILARATEEDIKQALREIADKISKGEFDKLKEWLKDKGAPLPEPPKAITIGTSAGDLPVDQAVLEYYKELSMQYPLVVTKKLLETDSTTRSWSDTEKWRPGKDPNLALPNSSGGKFLPGVTRSIKIAERPIRTTDYKVPHLLVVIDSSGSMPAPAERKSFGVLGGYCAARSYHLHGSSIGVINFSGYSFYLPYTRELDEALGAISAYQGGGTSVDVDMVRKMLGPEMAEIYLNNPHLNMRGLPREAIIKRLEVAVPQDVFSAESIDVLMFTDGGIANLNETLELFREKAQLNRATVILTHDSFEQEIKNFDDGRINVQRIEKAEDIPGVVIRETQENFARFVQVKK